jgi:hypothetical protein
LAAQGLYYLITGVWPLVSIETFEYVTGPKTDDWLVMTVGVLVTAIAIALLAAWWRKTEPLEIAILAIASAIGLTAIDVIYVARKVILPIYLVDAAVECVLIAGWITALLTKR